MAFIHGKGSAFLLDDSTPTLQDISNKLTSVDFPRTTDTAETSTLGNESKTYIVGLSDSTITIEGLWDTTIDAHLDGIRGNIQTFEYGPEGSTTGDIKYSGECIMTEYNPPASIDSAVTFSASFQVTGDVTRGTFA